MWKSCQQTVPEAVTAFLEGTNFEDVIRTAVQLGNEKMGAAGLEDRRGRRAGTQPARTPEEEMRDRIAELERINRDLQMENDLLKKVRELEMKDRYL